MTQKIAFCFLIYDIINHEEVWLKFFNSVDQNKYEIYIHYKTDKPLKYFDKYKIDNCIPTKYADVSLIHAHNLLFKKAYQDGCSKIISLSQSCIPFKPFNYIYEFLTKDDLAHFNIAPQSQCFPRCNQLLNYYKKKDIQKSSNWFILNRNITEIVTNYDRRIINKEFGNIQSPEEHFFITLIFKNNLEKEITSTPNLSNDATTFTNWQDMDYKYPSNRDLKNYSLISENEIIYLMNSKCLFGRKFNTSCVNYKNNGHIKKLKDDQEYVQFISST